MARKIVSQKQLEMFSEKELKDITLSILHENGMEYPSSKKMFVDIHEGSRNSLREQVNRILNNYLVQKELSKQGYETFDESDDFDIEDEDQDPISPYEITDMIEEEDVRPLRLEKSEKPLKGSDESGSSSSDPDSAGRKASDSAAD